jgi:hypothetical protein
MSKSVHIKVPKPCHENWQNMTPKEQGRFCGSCEKIVVDFSKMSDKEMLDYFAKATGHSTCGRFANDQLNRQIEPVANNRRLSPPYVWNLLLATVLFFESCNDTTTGEVVCEKPAVQQGVVDEPTMGVALAVVDTTKPYPPAEIKGKILCEGSDLPVAGAQVRIAGSKQKVVTDSKGGFSLSVENINPITLEVSAENFYTKTVQLNNKSDREHVKVMLFEKAFIMGEIAAEDVSGKKEECKSKEKQ